MNDSYQAIYDAVRSRLSNGDIGAAVESALGNNGISHAAEMCQETFRMAMYEHTLPSVLFRPILTIDGSMWCALYGENIQEGVAGFGKSPAKAMQDFDANWSRSLQ